MSIFSQLPTLAIAADHATTAWCVCGLGGRVLPVSGLAISKQETQAYNPEKAFIA